MATPQPVNQDMTLEMATNLSRSLDEIRTVIEKDWDDIAHVENLASAAHALETDPIPPNMRDLAQQLRRQHAYLKMIHGMEGL
jgi:hypothetical protein